MFSLLIKINMYNNYLYKYLITKIKNIPRLSLLQEERLGHIAFTYNNTIAAKKLVFHNIKLAVKIANQYKQSWSNIMDLIQEACVGMILASKKWNPNKGTQFGIYALYWIKAQLSKFLMLNIKLINISNTRLGRKIYFNFSKIISHYDLRKTFISYQLTVKTNKEHTKNILSILSYLKYNDLSLYQNTLENKLILNVLSPEDTVARQQLKKYIKKVINNFYFLIINKRDKSIWQQCIIANISINLSDLGKKYNISKQRIGQLIYRLKIYFKQYLIKKIGYRILDFN